MIAKPIDCAAGILGYCRGEVRYSLVACHPVNGSYQIGWRRRRVCIGDVKCAACEARITGIVVFHTPFEDVDRQAPLRSRHGGC